MAKKKSDKNAAAGVVVNIDVCCNVIRFDCGKIIEMAQKVAGRFGAKKARINFAVLGDDQIIGLNRKFLSKTGTTDVISFDLSDDEDSLRFFDIVVNAEMAIRQAKSRGHKSQAELALYFLHGLLHNLGFDDSTAKEAVKMHKTEDDILQEFGYGVVYNRKR